MIRLESAPGVGIYAHSPGITPSQSTKVMSIRSLLASIYPSLGNRQTHPNPEDDDILMQSLRAYNLATNTSTGSILGSCRFGFSSRKHLLNWFSIPVLKKLGEIGVEIVHYEVDSVLFGRAQCIVVFNVWEKRKELFRKNVGEWVNDLKE